MLSQITMFAALVAGIGAAPTTISSTSAPRDVYQPQFIVTNFHAYHTPGANAGLVSFDVAPGPNSNTTRCFGTEFSSDKAVLPNFNDQPCLGKNSLYQWTLNKNSTTSQWRFTIGEVDVGASYYFPPGSETTFQGNTLAQGTYAQLKAKDNTFTTEGAEGVAPPK